MNWGCKFILSCLLLTAVNSYSMTASGQDSSETDFFPLVAWDCGTDFPQGMSSSDGFKTMKECGLTVAGFYPLSKLAEIEAAGLKFFVSDPRANNYNSYNYSEFTPEQEQKMRQSIASLVKETGDNPTVLGYFVTDEPQSSAFKGLAGINKIFKELAPQKLIYINLLPNYAPPEMLQAKDYKDYLDKFFAEVQPAFGCYDFYGILENDYKNLRGGYWSNLAQMRQAALENQVPFWVVVLSTGHYNFRIPSRTDLCFEVFSSLAYGARGICYFTYLTPRFSNYRQGPIGHFGEKTPTYDALAYVNKCVLNWAPVLNKLTSRQVYHVPAEFSFEYQGPDDNSLLSTIDTVHNTAFVVGDFKHEDGSDYVMIVNKDLLNSAAITSLKFRKNPKTIEKVSRWEKGRLEPFFAPMEYLAPGEAILLKLSY